MKISRERQAGSAAFALSFAGILFFGRRFSLLQKGIVLGGLPVAVVLAARYLQPKAKELPLQPTSFFQTASKEIADRRDLVELSLYLEEYPPSQENLRALGDVLLDIRHKVGLFGEHLNNSAMLKDLDESLRPLLCVPADFFGKDKRGDQIFALVERLRSSAGEEVDETFKQLFAVVAPALWKVYDREEQAAFQKNPAHQLKPSMEQELPTRSGELLKHLVIYRQFRSEVGSFGYRTAAGWQRLNQEQLLRLFADLPDGSKISKTFQESIGEMKAFYYGARLTLNAENSKKHIDTFAKSYSFMIEELRLCEEIADQNRPFALESYLVALKALEVELDKFPTQVVTVSTPQKRNGLRRSQSLLHKRLVVTHSRWVCELVIEGLRKVRLPMTRGLTPATVDFQCEAFNLLRRYRNYVLLHYDEIQEETPEAFAQVMREINDLRLLTKLGLEVVEKLSGCVA